MAWPRLLGSTRAPDPRDEVIKYLQEQLRERDQRIDGLLDRAERSIEQRQPAVARPADQEFLPSVPDEVVVAIRQRAQSSDLQKELWGYAQGRLMVGTQPADVAHEILSGDWQ